MFDLSVPRVYIAVMRIAYLYNHLVSAADGWECDKVFVDLPDMNRIERADLVDRGGLAAGDVLVISKLSQLGHGRESTMIQDRIKAIGACIEVRPVPVAPKLNARSGWLVPTSDQKARICALWCSTQPATYVIDRASAVMGTQINRSWLNRHCGARSKIKRPEAPEL